VFGDANGELIGWKAGQAAEGILEWACARRAERRHFKFLPLTDGSSEMAPASCAAHRIASSWISGLVCAGFPAILNDIRFLKISGRRQRDRRCRFFEPALPSKTSLLKFCRAL
jgi:hypothetical protein